MNLSRLAFARQRWSFLGIDVALLTFSILIAFYLRLGWPIKPLYMEFLRSYIGPFIVIKLAIFYAFGLYRRFWRYASIHELRLLIQAVLASSLALLLFSYGLQTLPIPRSVFIVDGLLTLFLVGGLRFAGRTLTEIFQYSRVPAGARRALIVGAGDAGEMLVREMLKSPELGYVPIGFIDDDMQKTGLRIHGVQVLGTRGQLQELIRANEVREVIIAIPSADRRINEEIVRVCQSEQIDCRTLPGVHDLLDGRVGIGLIREVRIEDILGRDPVKVDIEAISEFINDKKVLVTGAGGSIGSELCRQISQFAPALLINIDINENQLYQVEMELAGAGCPVVTVVADIKDEVKMTEVIEAYAPDLVFHAAAYKHVPVMELNPMVALENNFVGTLRLARIAARAGVKKFVLVSTDKAVNPVNVMGTSKALAERAVLGLAGGDTEFIVVRFGNVLASNGSVVPIFKRQLAAGGPLTVTHPEMKRYLMTITESVQLILQAAVFGAEGEVYLLDMGEQILIIDLAKKMIELSGLDTERIGIEYTGIRPGEKLSEELIAGDESQRPSPHSKIHVITRVDSSRSEEYLVALDKIAALVVERRLPEATKLIAELIPSRRVLLDQQPIMPGKGGQ